jgi:CheY-like chemotaxis protein
MAGEAILIVDDNPANLKLTSYLLTNRGYQVRTALDARTALETLEAFHPQLILMDIQLPGMDGLELTRILKSVAATSDILIVAVTAFAMKGDEQKALAAGCDGYITKPIDTRELPGTLAALLAKAHSEKGA